MKRFGRIAWIGALCWSAMAASAWADGLILNGISPRSLSRGGTNIGHFDNIGVLHDNPAAMTRVANRGLFEAGGIGLITDFGYSDPTNNVNDTTFTPLPTLGLIQRSDDGIWAWGLGVFAPAGFSVQHDNLQGPFPLLGPRQYKSFGALMKVLPGVACQVTDRMSVGGTLGVGISHAELEGPYFLNGPGPLAGTPTMIDTQGTGAALVWSLGMQYDLDDDTTVGVTYQSQSKFNLNGSTRVEVPMFGETYYDSQIGIEWPQSVGIGVRHALCPHRAVSADVIWFNWSQAFDSLALRLRDPTNPMFPATDELFPLSWRDTVSLRLGYEQMLDIGGTLRLGYVYHRSPVPDGTLTPYIPATLEHAFSAGYGWDWCNWSLDLGYMFLFAPPRTVGTSDFVGGDFDNSRHTASVHALFLGLIRRF